MMSNTMSVEEYKTHFDINGYKSNSYEVAKFITFLMNKSVGNKEIEQLTGLKKSQVFSYKKVIKHNKVEEIRTTAFRKVLKSCVENTVKPKVEKDLVQAIEDSVREASPPKKGTREYYEGPHYFYENELSPGKSTFHNNDFCPCGLETGPTDRGQKFAHIPEFEFASQTYLALDEIYEYKQEIRDLKKRVEQLEMENSALRTRTVKRTSV